MPDRGPDPAAVRRVSGGYRRRRPLPAITLMVVLGLVATVVWIRTLDKAAERTDLACAAPTPITATTPPAAPDPNAPPPAPFVPPTPGEVLTTGALDNVDPLPPDAVKVRVLNAGGKRGQATLVAAVLIEDLGFASAGEPGDDPLYSTFGLDCTGQIRFGPAGEAAGRTLSIVMPCAELVRDQRQDDTVDLAIGQRFDTLQPNADALEVLRQLSELTVQPTDPAGGQQAAPATIDATLIVAARANTRC
ncbi:MAG TPA: envelope integrity protein Cei [Pseudonocardiaceae bacterium]